MKSHAVQLASSLKHAPRIYFSFRSPYSWLALTRLRRARPDLFDRVELIPYWDPDPVTESALHTRGAEFHYVQMSKAKHLYLLHDTKRLAAHVGVRMAWPIDIDPWWEPPHLAWLYARRCGRAPEFYAAVTAARWGRGEDICEAGVLGRLAAEAGLDPVATLAATDDADIRAESVTCLARAYDDDVFGIPYFRLGRHRFWGYDRVDEFLEALGSTLAEAEPDRDAHRPALAGALTSTYDTDTAGGCG